MYKLRLTNRDEIQIEDMSDKQLKLYLTIYSVYMEWFINLLILKTNIKEMDDEIKKSKYKFIKIDDEKLDFYQSFSRNYLDYFYLRNNLYLYRLNKEEYLFIVNRIKSNNYSFDDEVEKFILNTYRKVIFENVKDFKKARINHDKYDMGRYIENDSLIIGFRYETNNELNGKDWYDNLNFQEVEIQGIFENLLENLQKYFVINIALLDYK